MTALADIYNFLPLTDTLLTGGQPTEAQFQAVAEAGVKTVINLALATSPNALPDEAGLVLRLSMNYVHIPVVREAPSRKTLDQFMDTLDGQAGRKVLVHCAANMRSRPSSPSTASCGRDGYAKQPSRRSSGSGIRMKTRSGGNSSTRF